MSTTPANWTGSLDPDDPVHCDNCSWRGAAKELKDIADLEQRLAPGGEVPVGECPECGCLAYAGPEPTA